jgi:hypothetical protein
VSNRSEQATGVSAAGRAGTVSTEGRTGTVDAAGETGGRRDEERA